jgi:DNA-directed RNA polymerase subunit RPC12/RpoP
MKPSRLRDRPCAYPGCTELVLRVSTYCRHHLGVLHGGASARTYSCSNACQRSHARCARCRCLCNGEHARVLRDGLCYQPGAPSCWSRANKDRPERAQAWTVSCLLCGRERLEAMLPAELRCHGCGSRLLQATPSPALVVVSTLPQDVALKSAGGTGR